MAEEALPPEPEWRGVSGLRDYQMDLIKKGKGLTRT